MKEQFISDKVAIVNLQNLRWVRKNNHTNTFGDGKESFNIDLCYNVKQDPVMSIKYKKEKDRDSMYDRIADELAKRVDEICYDEKHGVQH